MIFSFDIWSEYGHFSHPATIYSSLTYPVPPKTTVMGMLAAIAGLTKTTDYLFLNKIKFSVILLNPVRKKNFCFNGIKDALPSINLKKGFQRVKKRKQFYRELLINPKYRIFVDFTECDFNEYKLIVENIKNHISVFPLYLGINLCLANFKYVDEFKGTKVTNNKEFADIDSFISLDSEFKIEVGKNYSDIRFSTFLDGNRFFGGYRDFLIELTGKTILCKPQEYIKIDSKYNIVMS